MIYSLSFYDIDMYNYIVKIFKSNGIYTVRADDLGDKLRLTGFNQYKTILTQIYVDEEYYFLLEEDSMYLNLNFNIMLNSLLDDVNSCIFPINFSFVVSEREDEDNNKYNEYWFNNLIDQVTFYTNADKSELNRLLKHLTCIGKKTSIGGGKIRKTVITNTDSDYSFYKDGEIMRCIPVKYTKEIPLTPGATFSIQSYKPPYWDNANKTMCLTPPNQLKEAVKNA